jgi:hypothetical protein
LPHNGQKGRRAAASRGSSNQIGRFSWLLLFGDAPSGVSGFAQDFATLGVERRKERKRPMPIIFKTVPFRPPWAQGQERIQPIQCLNGTFLAVTLIAMAPRHDYPSYNLEQQAQIVSDWFSRHFTKENPADNYGLASQSAMNDPYFRYITGNVRVGRF